MHHEQENSLTSILGPTILGFLRQIEEAHEAARGATSARIFAEGTARWSAALLHEGHRLRALESITTAAAAYYQSLPPEGKAYWDENAEAYWVS